MVLKCVESVSRSYDTIHGVIIACFLGGGSVLKAKPRELRVSDAQLSPKVKGPTVI